MAKIVASFLSEEQEFQRLQAEDARSVARRHGFEIDVVFAENNSIEQIQQLFKYIYLPEGQRPAAIVVETVVGEGLQRVARNAVKAGIGWILLNRKVGYLQDLRREYPKLPIATVGTDQVEVGRIQGRQVAALLPEGGGLLYIQGPTDTSASQERYRGMQEVTGSGRFDIKVLGGQWTEASGEKAIASFLRLRSLEGFRAEIVSCQNDAMAVGARRAVDVIPDEARRREWSKVVYLGCDGLPEGGQRLVRDRTLLATVITPSNAGAAVDLVVRALKSGQPGPPELTLAPTSYPDVGALRPLRA
jgi:ABC-type sugar transport system substrate-binding protein